MTPLPGWVDVTRSGVKPPTPPADGCLVTVLELTSSVQVGRQGIYDHDREIVAYEMLCRPMRAGFGLATEADHERATSHVISSIFGDFGVADIVDTRSLFINVTRAFIVGDLPLPDSRNRWSSRWSATSGWTRRSSTASPGCGASVSASPWTTGSGSPTGIPSSRSATS